ncbi:PREDICTED: eosinophil peroxidase-like [Nanorana parkeri]|uniref:eosinophil peroxidase-like n=1 Tax=Nanorana parkeri TaxID=125878 RepID=UPI000854EE79|nr:PREDICTED: eosinophil peroxidase-like [Nanorana parkeri]
MAPLRVSISVLLVLGLVQIGSASFYDGVQELDDDFILDSLQKAKKLVDVAYKHTRDVLKERLRKGIITPSEVMSYFKQPVASSRNHIRAADYIETTFDLLTEKLQSIYSRPFNISDMLTVNQLDMLHKASGYAFLLLPRDCPKTQYRTFTGECNNRRFPNFGVSNRPYTRLLRAQYEDGRSLPQGWTENQKINGFVLPLARAVSNEILRFPESQQTLDRQRSLMFMQWGQWIDHDLDLAPETPSRSTFLRGIDCDHSCARELPCFPLRIPPNDPRIKNRADCIPLFRSSPASVPQSPVREQMNILTSYVDASQVYGSTNELANKLRNRNNQLGLMAVNDRFNDNGRAYLPFSTNEEDFCLQTNKTSGLPCFLAGDGRVSEQPGLTAFHTIFVREHNRIATALRRFNPSWSGETLFQETRKIIGAVTQKINYKEWLPLLLGSATSRVLPSYRSYNDSVNPGASNVFSLVFRMGHTMIQPFIYRLGDRYRASSNFPPVPLHLTFFNTWRVVREGGVDPLLRGLMANRAKLNRQNQILVDELREHLFELFKRLGLDLGALNMQRGRDHGLPGYNTWRRFCGLFAPRNVTELARVLNNRQLAQKFIELYGTPENIDIWVGAVAEPLLTNARVGELLACLIGDQFRRTRDGDRFYYELPSQFTPAQRRSLERVTMSRIICDNTQITEVPRDVFVANSYPNDFVNCSRIPAFDLSPWRRRKSGSELEDEE